MDPPIAAGVETKPEKTNETNGNGKSHDCGLCDTEVVYKIAQELLPGLASACVDNTTGGIFKSAGSVAVDMRKEMVDYLTQRSESYVAEFLLADNASNEEISAHPYDIILSLIDDFSASKRNIFSRVSEWVLSDRREDRIDDFVQEMEINGFWLLARRECVASMLLKNVDYKNAFHCNMVCSFEEEVVQHRSECKFRPMDCTNEGCTTRYCAAQKENHEAICPFMILPCEQKCSDFVMRREMDRHCVTVCPMKLVNCAFYTVGCESSIPRCNVQEHNVESLSDHLLYILRTAHKEASEEDLKRRAEQIRNLSNTEKLARARDARALTYLIKDPEKKLGPLELNTEQSKEEKPSTDSPKKDESTENESSTQKSTMLKDDKESPTKEEVHPESPKKEGSDETERKVESSSSPLKKEDEKEKEREVLAAANEEEPRESLEKDANRQVLEEELTKVVKEESVKSSEKEESKESSSSDEESKKLPEREKTKESSGSDEEELKKTPDKERVEESKKSPKKETIEELSRDDEEEWGSTKRETVQESHRGDE